MRRQVEHGEGAPFNDTAGDIALLWAQRASGQCARFQPRLPSPMVLENHTGGCCMKSKIAAWALATVVVAAVLTPALAQSQVPPSAQSALVDDQRLRAAAAPDGNWIAFGRDYSNQRFAPLDTINRSNVTRLAPAWTYQ